MFARRGVFFLAVLKTASVCAVPLMRKHQSSFGNPPGLAVYPDAQRAAGLAANAQEVPSAQPFVAGSHDNLAYVELSPDGVAIATSSFPETLTKTPVQQPTSSPALTSVSLAPLVEQQNAKVVPPAGSQPQLPGTPATQLAVDSSRREVLVLTEPLVPAAANESAMPSEAATPADAHVDVLKAPEVEVGTSAMNMANVTVNATSTEAFQKFGRAPILVTLITTSCITIGLFMAIVGSCVLIAYQRGSSDSRALSQLGHPGSIMNATTGKMDRHQA